jgi:saccharopine dehydrogenase-like NADP-dependent oxidoreductase
VGPRKSYLIYHEEEESLVQNIKGLKQIRFWMTFSDNYIKHLDVLQSVGMTRIDPVMYKGHPVIPMEFLKELLPPPSSLGENYTGRTSIGCIIDGTKDGKRKTVLIYNVCDHADCYKETGAQAVSYTTGALSGSVFYTDDSALGGTTAYGIGASYDLGGGAKVVGGMAHDKDASAGAGEPAYDLGVSFSF